MGYCGAYIFSRGTSGSVVEPSCPVFFVFFIPALVVHFLRVFAFIFVFSGLGFKSVYRLKGSSLSKNRVLIWDRQRPTAAGSVV
ncbi:Hypothetical protein NTJ_11650 [Nesidiocoris tenuis]|uniref:Uncharacterized protein n=1 Tax=Nesidiocoris tenuis TaxID=355587 RepID=A0ABN7B5I1_9HEMI|nr:Hypothetical protein NTJ_11650 [Nesidiocoris tenuis]